MNLHCDVHTVIKRPRAEVAGFALDVANDPVWIGGIQESKMLTEPPLAEGTQIARVASFLGKRVCYTNEIISLKPDSLLVMRTIAGPFPMTLTYRFEDEDGGTGVSIQVESDATGFYALAAPVLSKLVRRSVAHDLQTLKTLLEANAVDPGRAIAS